MKRILGLGALVAAVSFLASNALAQPKDIVDTAVAAGSFKTLAKLLADADLVVVMKGPGPYTVFAPTDEAFAKVPKETLDALAKDKLRLQEVLKYHVLTSSWTTTDLKLVKTAGTATGQSVAIAVKDGAITINGARIVKADVPATNGMIQVIDAVLMPPK